MKLAQVRDRQAVHQDRSTNQIARVREEIASVDAGGPIQKPKLGIIISIGWGVRNYLLTDTLEVLKEHFELCVFSNLAEVDSFRDELENQGIRVFDCPELQPSSKAVKVFKLLEMAQLAMSATVRNRRKLDSIIDSRAEKLRGARLVSGRWAKLCYPPLRLLFRYLAASSCPSVRAIRERMEQEELVGVFSTNLSETGEWAADIAAWSLGLPMVASVTSWDNPSTKKSPPCDFDGYLVWSQDMGVQIQRFMGIGNNRRFHVVGAPQFDFYKKANYQRTREEFFAEYGLDPARKLIVYTTVTPGIVPDNEAIIRQVYDLMKSNQLPGDPQLLVRLHPKDKLERYESLRQDPSRGDIVWTLAGVPVVDRRDQWCPNHEDMVRAVNTIRHGDVNVHAGYSTMMLDFAAMDKPVVLVGYDSDGNTEKCKMWETYEHLRPVLDSGAVKVAYDPEELISQLAQSLAFPEERQEARAALTRFQIGEFDANSGKRAGIAVKNVVSKLGERTKRARRWRRATGAVLFGLMPSVDQIYKGIRRRARTTSIVLVKRATSPKAQKWACHASLGFLLVWLLLHARTLAPSVGWAIACTLVAWFSNSRLGKLILGWLLSRNQANNAEGIVEEAGLVPDAGKPRGSL
ncbi:MAG: hypothetical protein U1D30_00770 [Planctomycetota bacterium]